MPSGQVHAACSVLLAPISGGLVAAFTNDFTLGLACGAGCLLGIALTPDLDQETLCSSEATLVRWTFGLAFLWVMMWYPYARLIPHRSPLSHAPILGTGGRLLYLGLVALGPALLLGWRGTPPPLEWWAPLGWMVAGLALSDAAHGVFDVLWSKWRRMTRIFR